MGINTLLFVNYIEESISDLIMLTSLKDIKYKNIKQLFMKILLFISIFSVMGYILETNIPSFSLLKVLQILLYIVLIFMLFKTKVSETILLFAINFALIYLIQEPIVFSFHFLANDISDYRLGILGNFITIIILLIIKKYAPIKKNYESFISEKYAFKIIIINLFIIFQIEDYYYKAQSDIYNMNMMFFIICFLIIVILNFIIIYEEKIVFQKEKELNTSQINSVLMENMISEIIRNQHQYDNRINALISLANVCVDYDSLKTEILKCSETVINNSTDYDVLKLNLICISGANERIPIGRKFRYYFK